MRWIKRSDSFVLTRSEIYELIDFLDPTFEAVPNNQKTGWEEFKRKLQEYDKLLLETAEKLINQKS